MRPQYEPRWCESGLRGGRAHLLLPGGTWTENQNAWCGIGVDARREAPYLYRCKDCLKLVQQYLDMGTVVPPPRVVAVVTLSITHNNTESFSEVVETLVRRAQGPARNPSWDVQVVEKGTP